MSRTTILPRNVSPGCWSLAMWARSEERRDLLEHFADVFGFARVVAALCGVRDLFEHVGLRVGSVTDREDADSRAFAVEADALEQRAELRGAVAIRAVRQHDQG